MDHVLESLHQDFTSLSEGTKECTGQLHAIATKQNDVERDLKRLEASVASALSSLHAVSGELKELSAKQLASAHAQQSDAREAFGKLEERLVAMQQSMQQSGGGGGYTLLLVSAQVRDTARRVISERVVS